MSKHRWQSYKLLEEYCLTVLKRDAHATRTLMQRAQMEEQPLDVIYRRPDGTWARGKKWDQLKNGDLILTALGERCRVEGWRKEDGSWCACSDTATLIVTVAPIHRTDDCDDGTREEIPDGLKFYEVWE